MFQNKATGPGRDMALDAGADDLLSHGRLAFYGKAKIDGKYLLTAQADTQERDIRDLFKGLGRADPSDVFRRLDPNAYYPVNGDDSTSWRDVDTQGRLYLRVDWDKNQALWGNYATGLGGTQYAQYLRSLYGAALGWRSLATNAWGEPRSQLRAFASEVQSAPGHSEFIGTGGSLYYLRHTDVLPGSEQVTLEIRDPATGSVEQRVVLVRGVDYTLNELQGRILLSRPLSQFSGVGVGTLTRDRPLSGFEQRLLVDYEWVPRGFDADQLAAGARAKQWLGENVAVGGTWVQERRAGDDYRLQGVDLTWQAGRGTVVKLEHSRSESTGTPVFVSDNGGFDFVQTNAGIGHREGEASALELQANFKEIGWTERNASLRAWSRQVDAGYSVARNDSGLATREHGAQLRGELSDTVALYALVSRVERGAESLQQLQLTGQWRASEDDTLSAEVRRVTEQRSTGEATGLLGALQYTRRVTPNLEAYGVLQATLDDDGGRYADNDALTLGARYRFGALSTLGLEATQGDRGHAVTANAEYQLTPEHSLYGRFTGVGEGRDGDSVFNPRQQGGWTLGQRWRLGERSNLFNESQYLKDPQAGSGLAHTFGMDFYPGLGWNAGFTLQEGELDGLRGTVHRRAVSVHGGRSSAETAWTSKVEWRRDTGAEQRTQWVLVNRLSHKLDQSWRVSARFNYADTQDHLNAAAGARYVESGVGFAWRPYDQARYALLGRYTHLQDLATLAQVGGAAYDQRSDIVSIEGTYQFDHQWGAAAKLAWREGQARLGRGSGAWFDSSTRFAAAQLRYELPEQWHAMAEYRVLSVKEGGTRQGWMAGVDRDIGRHLRVGLGYNFTDFSDDLTKFDYRYKGFFIHIVPTEVPAMNKNKQVPWGRLMASVATGLLAATAQLAQAQSFGACDSRLWISQEDTLYSVGMGTNPFSYTAVGTSSTNINAIDFNTADNFLYGMRSGSSNMLVRLGTSGVAVNVGAVSGLPTAGYINGAFAPAGNLLYVKSGANDNVMYRINVSTRVATAITLSRAITTADFAFVGSTLYSVESDGQLISIATSGSPALVTNIGTPQLPTGFLGAMFGTPSRLYGSHNSGGFYQVDLATGWKTLISSSPPSNANDGAHCPRAELSFGADLAITKTNTPAAGASDQANDRYVPGTAITYTIVVSNNGPFGAANVTVRDPLPSGITSASWTCSGTGGATCPASGTGAIDTSEVSLPVGGKATFLHTLTVPDSRTADLSNTATVSVGAGSTDPDASNNSATDSDPPVARLTVRKISEGGVGSFSFTGSNGVAAHSVTTVTAGTAASGAVQVLTAPNTATTVTESAAAAYLLTGISCTGLGSGSATPNLATRTVSLSAAATAPGAHVICTFTNAKQPVLRLGKALPDGRIQASDQFALSIAGEGGPATATTTGASGAPGETAVLNPASIGSSYTLSESGSGGTDLAAYSSSYSCSNALPGGQAPSGNGTSFTLVPVAGDDLTCLFSNGAAKADLSVSKAVSPASARTGEVVVYTLTVNNAGPRAADGAVLRDTPGAGLDCSAPATTASCSASGGAACPGATVPVASLTGASGVTLPALPMGGSVVVTLQCTVTASGL